VRLGSIEVQDQEDQVISAALPRSESGPLSDAARLNLDGQSILGERIHSRRANLAQFQPERRGGSGFGDVAHEPAIERETQICLTVCLN
jgi:hypothetical protein